MVNSMTGFGRACAQKDGRSVTVEIKSVNHRYLDLGFRVPRVISFAEDVLRGIVSSEISRGHADVFVFYENHRDDAKKVEVDAALLGQYLSAAREVSEKFSLRDDIGLSAALRLPDVTRIAEAEEDREAVCEIAAAACRDACAELKVMRAKEGARLYADMYEKSRIVEKITDDVALRAPGVAEDYRAKLNERIEKLLPPAEIDRARLATEVALFADRAGIDEEIVRLKSHTAQFRAMLEGGGPVGRKLDFIVQEMNREFNTIGSKANDNGITALVIAGKGEVEKMREQVQNIE